MSAGAPASPAAADAVRRGRTLKFTTILVVLIGGGLGLTAATQTWYTVSLAPGFATVSVTVSGSQAAPALTALSLAGLALAIALAIAGRLARIIIGVLGLVVAACILFSSIGSAERNAGLLNAVGTATSITGRSAIAKLILHMGATAWPVAAVIAGVIVAIGSLSAVVTGAAWPGASRRYDAVRFDDADAPVPASTRPKPAARPGDAAVDDWDELTRGDDPTAGGPASDDDGTGIDTADDDAGEAPAGSAPDAR